MSAMASLLRAASLRAPSLRAACVARGLMATVQETGARGLATLAPSQPLFTAQTADATHAASAPRAEQSAASTAAAASAGGGVADSEASAAVGLPTFPAIITREGATIPLLSDDEDAELATVSVQDAAARRREVMAQAYYRADVRATYDTTDVETYVSALARTQGDEVELTDMETLTREDELPAAEDPLQAGELPFNIKAVSFVSHLTLNAPPGAKQLDRRANLSARVSQLGLHPAAAKYVRLIAGAHYNPRTDTIKISSEHHTEAAMNKRHVLEQLVALVSESERLYATHGEFKAAERFAPYAH